MKKCILSFALVLSLILALAPTAAMAAESTASSWAKDSINQAISMGIVPSALQSNYQQAVTRAEFCALAVALYENIKGEITGRKAFTDTKDINVEKAAAVGIVSGTNSEGTIFSPDSQLTREMAAVMLSRLATSIGNPLQEQAASFADNAGISPWAVADVGKIQAAGIMSGADNKFSPKNSYTREQSIVTIMRLHDVVNDVPKTGLSQGYYTIKNADGKYLSYLKGHYFEYRCSRPDEVCYWYFEEFENGKFNINGAGLFPDMAFMVYRWDIEGGEAGFLPSDENTRSILTWTFTSNNDGTFQIHTVMGEKLALTKKSDTSCVIETYSGKESQKWILERVEISEAESKALYYKHGLMLYNNSNVKSIDNIVLLPAERETDKSIKDFIKTNQSKTIMIEGKHIILHFPSDIWAKYDNPKKVIDIFDSIYEAQLEMLDGITTKINKNKKMLFTTDHGDGAPYMYATGYPELFGCSYSLVAAEANVKEWNEWKFEKDGYPIWGIGHEIGHIMVNAGMGYLFDLPAAGNYSGESMNNILCMYAYYKLGIYDIAREYINVITNNYPGENGKYSKYNGTDYDKLSDNQRSIDVLIANNGLFVKLPVLLIDNYGWDGIKAFFTKAAEDTANGVTASEEMQGRIDYMVLNLSKSYGMDLSAIFEYWKLFPSKQVKDTLSDLPKEQIIAKSYGLK